MSDLQFTCKCIACGKRFSLTLDQIEEAQDVGCAISPCCNFPSTVERAAYGHDPFDLAAALTGKCATNGE